MWPAIVWSLKLGDADLGEEEEECEVLLGFMFRTRDFIPARRQWSSNGIFRVAEQREYPTICTGELAIFLLWTEAKRFTVQLNDFMISSSRDINKINITSMCHKRFITRRTVFVAIGPCMV
jgi:hypothetical protein